MDILVTRLCEAIVSSIDAYKFTPVSTSALASCYRVERPLTDSQLRSAEQVLRAHFTAQGLPTHGATMLNLLLRGSHLVKVTISRLHATPSHLNPAPVE